MLRRYVSLSSLSCLRNDDVVMVGPQGKMRMRSGWCWGNSVLVRRRCLGESMGNRDLWQRQWTKKRTYTSIAYSTAGLEFMNVAMTIL